MQKIMIVEDDPASSSRMAGSSSTIMIVEDDPAIREELAGSSSTIMIFCMRSASANCFFHHSTKARQMSTVGTIIAGIRGPQRVFRQILIVYRRFCSVSFAFQYSLKPVFPRVPRLSVANYVVRK